MMQAALTFPVTTQAESYIVKRLKEHGAFIYPVSDSFPLKERIRRAIIDGKHDHTIIGRNSATKKCETYSECFERLYAEPLEPTKGKKKRAQSQPA
jgi:hypothetical protein